jgi:hypothetical protein
MRVIVERPPRHRARLGCLPVERQCAAPSGLGPWARMRARWLITINRVLRVAACNGLEADSEYLHDIRGTPLQMGACCCCLGPAWFPSTRPCCAGSVWRPCWPRGIHSLCGELSEHFCTRMAEHGARQTRAFGLWPWQGFVEMLPGTGALSGKPLAQHSSRLAACMPQPSLILGSC